MSQWLQSAKATVSAGAAVISFTDNKDFASVRAGDVVMINGQIWQCSSGTRPDSAGKSTVTLAAPWPYTGASNVNAFVFRTTHDLLQLTSDARKLTNITKALLVAQEDILKGTTPTINVPIGLNPATGNEEVIQVTPWQYVINVVNASLGNISAIGAMSQAQFEAIREQNKESYAASGWVSLGNHESGKQVNECKPGLYTSPTTPNTLLIGKAGGVGGSKNDNAVLNMAGVLFHLPVGFGVKFSNAPDGKTTYNNSTGVITNHATVAAAFNAQAADPVNVEVVTDRKDMWGFEAFQQEVTLANPEIYPQGVFSDLFTSMNGIPTSDSARPVSYFGFLGKKAKKVDFFAQSDAQKKKVLADPKNNLFYSDDGRLIQWVLRGCEFSGAGNGDWANFSSPFSTQTLAFNSTQSSIVPPQGSRDIPLNQTWINSFVGSKHLGNATPSLGVFTANKSSGVGECYFLVCGTVNRLSQGAYHHSLNPSGTRRFTKTNIAGNLFWYHSLIANIQQLNCFYNPDGLVNEIGYGSSSGAISTGLSGRPDGRYYDAIYADGQGGVCRDMRYSANGIDLVDLAEADQKVKDGTYRGFERIKFTSNIVPETTISATRTAAYFIINVGDNTLSKYSWIKSALPTLPTEAHGYFLVNGVKKTITGVFKSGVALIALIVSEGTFTSTLGETVYGCFGYYKPISVGGSFLQTDVIGNPTNILETQQLANGWQGSWIPVIPISGSIFVPLNRDKIGSNPLYRFGGGNGNIWESYPTTHIWNTSSDGQSNGFTLTASNADNLIVIYNYQAFSRQTESAPNAAIYGLVPYNVFASSDYRPENGALLGESLIGKVLKNNIGVSVNNKSLLSCAIDGTGKLTSASNFDGVTHSPLTLGAPANNSPAFKVVSYLANINQQAVPHFAYTELKHNGTSFGDDGKQTIVDNQSTKPNDHDVTVSVGTARLREPIGWFKNKV